MEPANKYNRILIALTPLISLGLYACIVYLMMAPRHAVPPLLFSGAKGMATILLLLTIAGIVYAYYTYIMKSRLPELAKNLLLLGTLAVVTLLSAECYFLHYERSRVIGEQWCYKLWDMKYIKERYPFFYPGGKASFRKAPVSNKRRKVWFIGDSFTFGFGLEKTSETFPARVEQILGQQTGCINLGDGGADTYKEKENLLAFEKQQKQMPEVVVWQYFGNDIDLHDQGPDLYERQQATSSRMQFGKKMLKGKSFLLDFIYWNYVVARDDQWIKTYNDFLNKAYQADSVRGDEGNAADAAVYKNLYRNHLVPVKESGAFCKSRNTGFLVVIFPFLWTDGPENSAKLYADRMEAELKAGGTDVINLAPLLKYIPEAKRVASPQDPHPSALVNQVAADTIAAYLHAKYGM